jgi:putative deoxyribonucleoside 5'-monophosphate N-glycosidase
MIIYNKNKMDKRIYFAGSIRGGRVDVNLYQRIIAYINKTDIVLTEHIGMSDISLNAQGKTNDYEIYKQDTDWLKSSDLVIAECTLSIIRRGI